MNWAVPHTWRGHELEGWLQRSLAMSLPTLHILRGKPTLGEGMRSRVGGRSRGWHVLNEPFSQDKAPASSATSDPSHTCSGSPACLLPASEVSSRAPSTRCHAHSRSLLPRHATSRVLLQPTWPRRPRAQEALWSKRLPLCRMHSGAVRRERQETNFLTPSGPGSGLGWGSKKDQSQALSCYPLSFIWLTPVCLSLEITSSEKPSWPPPLLPGGIPIASSTCPIKSCVSLHCHLSFVYFPHLSVTSAPGA